MSSNKTGIRNMSVQADTDLGKTLLAIMAVGFAGAAALIGSAKALGDYIEERRDNQKGDK